MRTLPAVLLAALLAGCGGGLTREAAEPAVYRLAPPAIESGAPVAADLVVERPTAAPGLETDRIATSWPDRRLDYYASARWSGELPLVVQSLAVEALDSSGRLRSVHSDAVRIRATHALHLDVRRFEADYARGTVPVVRVVLAASVSRRADGQQLAAFTVTAEAPAGANTLTAVVAAFDAAQAQAVKDLAVRTLEALAAESPRQP
jgi:ABC-type uncharacterized transport system auxiliary subunit